MMTKTLEKKIPKIWAQDGAWRNAMVYAHYFYWWWDWYVLEFDGDNEMFGIVKWVEIEYWYFTLSELKSTRKVERDLYWDMEKASEIPKIKDLVNSIYPLSEYMDEVKKEAWCEHYWECWNID